MKTWFFTEDAYPHLPYKDSYESIRVNLPNRHFDPDTGADRGPVPHVSGHVVRRRRNGPGNHE